MLSFGLTLSDSLAELDLCRVDLEEVGDMEDRSDLSCVPKSNSLYGGVGKFDFWLLLLRSCLTCDLRSL